MKRRKINIETIKIKTTSKGGRSLHLCFNMAGTSKKPSYAAPIHQNYLKPLMILLYKNVK